MYCGKWFRRLENAHMEPHSWSIHKWIRLRELWEVTWLDVNLALSFSNKARSKGTRKKFTTYMLVSTADVLLFVCQFDDWSSTLVVYSTARSENDRWRLVACAERYATKIVLVKGWNQKKIDKTVIFTTERTYIFLEKNYRCWETRRPVELSFYETDHLAHAGVLIVMHPSKGRIPFWMGKSIYWVTEEVIGIFHATETF